ncbi:MAG: 2-oxoisovalerate dehydrogenase [Candidatus Sumerlaeia bacterium]|nr:2-oxoisovalerate dehydrogenase [Candidatus Sumerlaeia bacterium]
MSELVFLVEADPEGGFTARALGESIFTHADEWKELEGRVREATLCHFDEGEAPRIVRLHFVRDEVFAV